MNSASFDVMNNNDLLRLILTYLRSKPKKSCQLCKRVCIWDKKVCKFIDLTYYPWNMYGTIYCYECYKSLPTPGCYIC